MGWPQLVRNVFLRLIFFGFFWLFAESSHIGHSRLLFGWGFGWRRLSVDWRFTICRRWRSFLPFRLLLRFFLLRLLVLGRNGVEHSGRF
jgi:hypothetical protein